MAVAWPRGAVKVHARQLCHQLPLGCERYAPYMQMSRRLNVVLLGDGQVAHQRRTESPQSRHVYTVAHGQMPAKIFTEGFQPAFYVGCAEGCPLLNHAQHAFNVCAALLGYHRKIALGLLVVGVWNRAQIKMNGTHGNSLYNGEQLVVNTVVEILPKNYMSEMAGEGVLQAKLQLNMNH